MEDYVPSLRSNPMSNQFDILTNQLVKFAKRVTLIMTNLLARNGYGGGGIRQNKQSND